MMSMNVSQDNIIRKNNLIREGLREILTRISVHRQSAHKKNIILISSGRTGSTLLMESISAEPGLRFVNEPFSRKHLIKSDYAKLVKAKADELDKKIISLNEDDREEVLNYLTDYKQIRRSGPYNPFKPNFHLKSDRLIYKILKMNMVMDLFFEQEDQYHFLWLVRHPGPTILSSLPMRTRFKAINLKSYLEEDRFRDNYLSEVQIEMLEKAHREGKEHEIWAAEWAMDHLIPFRYFENNPLSRVLLVSYEQLILQPELVLSKIADSFGLERLDLILNELQVPSASTRTASLKGFENFDPQKKIRQWRSKSSPEFEKDIFDIIETFEIGLYTPERDLLKPEYLIE